MMITGDIIWIACSIITFILCVVLNNIIIKNDNDKIDAVSVILLTIMGPFAGLFAISMILFMIFTFLGNIRNHRFGNGIINFIEGRR